MQRKSGVIVITILFLALAVAGAFVCLYLGKAFKEQDLKAVGIQLIDQNASTDAVSKNTTKDSYLLSDEQKAQLFQALSSVSLRELLPEQIACKYSLVVDNRWGFSRQYTVFFTDNQAVWLQDSHSKLFSLNQPDFFYSHEGFNDIYAERLKPLLQVTLNEVQAGYTNIDGFWDFQKYDGQWSPQKDDAREISPILDDKGDLIPNDTLIILSGTDKLAVQTAKVPDSSHLKIVNSATGKVVWNEQADITQLPFPKMNGEFSYVLTMEWTDESKPYRGKAVINIPVSLDLPEEFAFSKKRLIQGEMLEVSVYYVDKPEDIIFKQALFEEFQWYEEDSLLRGYIPTNYSTRPGSYQIKYGNRRKGTEYSQTIEVGAHSYHIQQLVIDDQVEQETRNESAYEEFAKYFTPVRKKSAVTRYYAEPFTWPTQGRLTTEFGQIRYVNGAPTSSRHSGLDIAAQTGTEIKAANRGKVVLSMPLTLTGNTIVIDHGQGLFSVYYHLHEAFAASGEIVERGQKIGTVGSTGFSTGPHLHFTMSYYLMNIEPGFIIVGQPLTFANYPKYLQK